VYWLKGYYSMADSALAEEKKPSKKEGCYLI